MKPKDKIEIRVIVIERLTEKKKVESYTYTSIVKINITCTNMMDENTKVCFFFFPQEIFYNTKNDRLFPIYM